MRGQLKFKPALLARQLAQLRFDRRALGMRQRRHPPRPRDVGLELRDSSSGRRCGLVPRAVRHQTVHPRGERQADGRLLLGMVELHVHGCRAATEAHVEARRDQRRAAEGEARRVELHDGGRAHQLHGTAHRQHALKIVHVEGADRLAPLPRAPQRVQ